MKKETKQAFGEITWTILAAIARTPEAIIGGFLDQEGLKRQMESGEDFLGDKFIQYLRNLKRTGYIEIKEQNCNLSVRLTVKGKIKNLESPKNLEVDGRLRIISYDIPENYNIKRRQFCRSLKRIGFKQLQKSLWVCQYIKADEIDLIIDELEIREYVAYFIIAKSNIEEHLDNLFRKRHK
ncbi:MAG: hypothetical protein NTW79_03035 [Candidatus Berkelbacteria bacterium]|nr:hypothetical protein [Candidatus Berkelbacteria bacterium]